MRALPLLAASVLTAALAVGVVAGPASAAETDVTGTISVSTTHAATTSYGKAPVTVSTNLVVPGHGGSLQATIVSGGKSYNAGAVAVPSSGKVSVDLLRLVNGTLFHSEGVAAGTYAVSFSGTSEYYYVNDAPVSVSAAKSSGVYLSVSKVKTTISGWSSRSRSLHSKGTLKLPALTIANPGFGSKRIAQYRTSLHGAWHTVGTVVFTAPSNSTQHAKLFFDYVKSKHGHVTYITKGTWYFRVIVTGTKFSTGTATSSLKVVVR